MKKLLRAIAVALLGVGMSAGVAAAQTGTIGTTGPDSNNQIKFDDTYKVDVESKNEAKVDNDTEQKAWSGEAEVEHNTTGGSARSGDARNTASTSTSATLRNSSVAMPASGMGGGSGGHSATINHTGPDSNNQVEFDNYTHVEVESRNYVNVENDTDQWASTGDAEVKGNTTGGSATSGSASNTSTTSTTLNLSN